MTRRTCRACTHRSHCHISSTITSRTCTRHPPSARRLDGVHPHDDLLEDLSRQAIDAHVRALSGFGRRLHQIDPTAPLRSRSGSTIRSWRPTSRRGCSSWKRCGPGSATPRSTRTPSAAASRARRSSPTRRRPSARAASSRSSARSRASSQAARDNIKDPPGIFVKVGIETLPRRAALHRVGSAARVLATSTTCTCWAISRTRRPRRRTAIGGYVEYLETDLAPKARASFRLGRERFEQKLKLEEGVGLSADRLLAIAMRELAATQEEFRTRRRPVEWRRSRRGVAQGEGRSTPRRASSSRGAASSSASSQTFLERADAS